MPSSKNTQPALPLQSIEIYSDRWLVSLGMSLIALLVSTAIETNEGTYSVSGLILIAMALAVGAAAIAIKSTGRDATIRVCLSVSLALGILTEFAVILNDYSDEAGVMLGAGIIAAVAILCLVYKWLAPIAVAIMSVCFACTAVHYVNEHPTGVDVYMFQRDGAVELLKGKNPYAMRFPNVYPKDADFYGPGVVDENNMLTIGFPYPPASLLMVLPASVVHADIRYCDVAALVISAALMALAIPRPLSAMAAGLFLLSPTNLLVVRRSWTESLLLLSFSLVMFLAVRGKRLMPYALGLFFATKQSSVLALPAVALLGQPSGYWRHLTIILLKAFAVAAVITVPFFLWNPHEFWHVVVQWQFVQPFRTDALSFMVWLRKNNLLPWLFTGPEHRPSMLITFALAGAAVIVSLWPCPRTPSGFAACVCLVNVVFFAFSKQAFCNYYFFAVGAACWAVAAAKPPVPALARPSNRPKQTN